MRILCLEQFSRLGGGQLSLLDLLPALSRRGWEPIVATPGEGPLTHSATRLGVEVMMLSAASYSSGRKTLADVTRYAYESPKLICDIARMVSSKRIHLLYVNAPRLLPAAALVARLWRIPLVFHCHNRIAQRTGVLVAGPSLRLSRARVIACCRYAADPIRWFIRSEDLAVVYNGVGQMGRHAADHSTRVRRIGIIGRVEPEKGQMEFVRAARLLIDRFGDCQFSVIGAPVFSGADYCTRVVEASRGLPIEFLGWRDDIATLLAGLDLLAVPSSSLDSTPRVILEAFAAGVPVVAFPSGGIPEIVEDEQTGFLTAAATADALAQRISSILEMAPATLQAVVQRAGRRWQDEHTLDIYQDRVANFLSQAAAIRP